MNEGVGIALVIANDRLRGLVELYLARNGFDVVSAAGSPEALAQEADIVITESSAVRGRLFTVRLTEAIALPTDDPAVVLAPDDLGTLPDLLHTELSRRQKSPV